MTKNIILKEAFILIFVSLITISSIAVTGNINDLQEKYEKNFTYSNVGSRGDIVWDNDMVYEAPVSAMWDEVHNYDFTVADDFIFTENTVLNGVNWVGGYEGQDYQQGNFDWAIVIYDDDGSGNAPGIITNVLAFTPSQYNKVFLEDDGSSIFYKYSVELPEPIHFQANTKYWIAIFGVGTWNPMSTVGVHLSILLHSCVYGSNYMGRPYWTDSNFDVCFQLIEAKADLDCEGSLIWAKIKPGTVEKGEFYLENIGEAESLLDWEVSEVPEWGTWIFEPEDGEDLTPEDGIITVNVTVIAPDEKNMDYSGHITIINTNDNSDLEIIDVLLSTPRKRTSNNMLFEHLIERFPNTFLLLRYLFALQ